jgi:hypothetical protein
VKGALRLAVMALGVLAASRGARASVQFADWRATSLGTEVDRAAFEHRILVLVVTQPDWCPPCIKLDKTWLKNDADATVRDMTAEAVVLEVHGYDEPEAGILRSQGVLFRGTPTTHVYAPSHVGSKLGDARLIGSIVGAPDDYPEQLKHLIAGEDPIGDLERKVHAESDRVARCKLLLELGDAYASRGDTVGARLCFQNVRHASRSFMTLAQQAQLDELRRDAAWRQADGLTLRVRKAWREALGEIEAYEQAFRPRAEEKARNAYAKAWALVHLDRTEEALRLLRRDLADDADGAETFLYFCFRSDDPVAWTWGERFAGEALLRFPEHRAALLEGDGRIARRQGRLADAERVFTEAVALEKDPEQRLVYEGELETVRNEIAGKGEKVARADVTHDGRSHHGSGAGAVRVGLGR